MTSNTGTTVLSLADASSTSCSMRASATTSEPKPVRIRPFELPTGMICCVFASVSIVRIEFDNVRTSVFGRCITVVISVAGWSA